MWTKDQALQVLADGNLLEVSHPRFPASTLIIERRLPDGRFEAWFENNGGEPMRAGVFLWGEFAVVGFGLLMATGFTFPEPPSSGRSH